jgi:hypothetical protein
MNYWFFSDEFFFLKADLKTFALILIFKIQIFLKNNYIFLSNFFFINIYLKEFIFNLIENKTIYKKAFQK